MLIGVLHTYCTYLLIRRRNKGTRIDLGEYDRHKIRKISLRRIVFDFELSCIENMHMDRRSFMYYVIYYKLLKDCRVPKIYMLKR